MKVTLEDVFFFFYIVSTLFLVVWGKLWRLVYPPMNPLFTWLREMFYIGTSLFYDVNGLYLVYIHTYIHTYTQFFFYI